MLKKDAFKNATQKFKPRYKKLAVVMVITSVVCLILFTAYSTSNVSVAVPTGDQLMGKSRHLDSAYEYHEGSRAKSTSADDTAIQDGASHPVLPVSTTPNGSWSRPIIESLPLKQNDVDGKEGTSFISTKSASEDTMFRKNVGKGNSYPTKPPKTNNSSVSNNDSDNSPVPLSYTPRIMCMIFTIPENWNTKALAVKLTWAKRCDYHLFFYSKTESVTLPGAIPLDIPEGRDHLTGKTVAAFRYCYNLYKNKVHWFLKADDDAYFIIENLKYLLSKHDVNKPQYIGHRSDDFLIHGYNGGGAGYLLNNLAVNRMLTEGDMFPDACPVDGAVEDLDIGRCLETLHIYPVETRDENFILKFHPDHPIKLLMGEQGAVTVYTYSKYNYTFGHSTGIRVMSPEMISFHYMDVGHMYMYDFLLYDLKRATEFISP